MSDKTPGILRTGIGVSRGIATGKILLYQNEALELKNTMITVDHVDTEKQAVAAAAEKAVCELQASLDKLDPEKDQMMADILEIQIELAEDPGFISKINHFIEISLNEASDAVIRASEEMAHMFEEMDDEYYSARAADIRDIGSRISRHARGQSVSDLSSLQQDCIVFANDITPSETVNMDKKHVLGFVSTLGSKTSHAAILANILGIPAVVGVDLSAVEDGGEAIIDGTTGEVILGPNNSQKAVYQSRKEKFIENEKRLKCLKSLPAETQDGHRVELCINIADPRESALSPELGGDGVGLFRTEFLYMNSSELPSEEVQFNAYKTAAMLAEGQQVIIRTLDIGGDKNLPYLQIPKEDNPFLGYRAIRICLDQPAILKTQLRAILRAGVWGNLKIMFPMICSKSEFIRARQVIKECEQELDNEGIICQKGIPVGIMVETPCVAAAAEVYAGDVDFFSIGTNDLCQYALAVDRMNAKVAGLYNPFNPGVLRLIHNTIQAGKNAGIMVGMCGEMAGELSAVPLLIGMGLQEFSVSPSHLPYVKDVIRNINYSHVKALAEHVLTMDSAVKIKQYLEENV